MPDLPAFSEQGYKDLLVALRAAGYALLPVEAMPEHDRRAVHLRHDIDLHVPGVERFSAIEREAGAQATYFVPLTLHFNPAYPENRALLRGLVADGHRIGLHYDLRTYPTEAAAAWRHLDTEVQRLQEIVEAPVASICMHFPWGGLPDIFRASETYVHPHAPPYDDVLYVSDSSRAWRDESLLRCFSGDAPERVQLLTHHELWLGRGDESRRDFLFGTLTANTLAQHRAYVQDMMWPAWENHPGPALHDERERWRGVRSEA